MNKKEQELRKLFLELFILSLIKNIPVPAPEEPPKKSSGLQTTKTEQTEFPKQPPQLPEQMQPSMLKMTPDLKKTPSAPAQPPIQAKPRQPLPRPPPKPPPRLLRRPFFPQRPRPLAHALPQNLQNPALTKVSQFLFDPRVRSIECTGPGKPVLINKSNMIQHTTITLTKEEINNIIGEISKKTRIPVISGVFKAAFDNFVITAVISDFIGTRFIIEKKVPGMPQNEPFKRLQF